MGTEMEKDTQGLGGFKRNLPGCVITKNLKNAGKILPPLVYYNKKITPGIDS